MHFPCLLNTTIIVNVKCRVSVVWFVRLFVPKLSIVKHEYKNYTCYSLYSNSFSLPFPLFRYIQGRWRRGYSAILLLSKHYCQKWWKGNPDVEMYAWLGTDTRHTLFLAFKLLTWFRTSFPHTFNVGACNNVRFLSFLYCHITVIRTHMRVFSSCRKIKGIQKLLLI